MAWLHDEAIGPLQYSDVDGFIAHRQATGELRNGERAALHRLRGALVDAGVVVAPPPPDGPRDRLLGQFESSLRRRGYRQKSIASYLWFSRPFVSELWEDTAGLAQLTSVAVLGYIERHASDRCSTTALIMCSRLRVFLRFLQAEGHVVEDLAAAVPSARNTRSTTLPAYMPSAQVEAIFRPAIVRPWPVDAIMLFSCCSDDLACGLQK